MPGPPKLDPIAETLERFGLTNNLVQKVRFKGVVGKLCLFGIFAVVTVGGIGVRSASPGVEICSLVVCFLLIVLVAGGCLWYSHLHPEQATLEGMEVILFQQQKAWASKGGQIGDSPIIANPGAAPPQINPPGGVDE